MKKRILFVGHSSAICGGGEDDFERLLNYFSRLNEFEIYGFFPYGPRAREYSKYCKESICYRFGWLPYNYENIWSYLKFAIKVLFFQIPAFLRILKLERPNLVIFNVGALPQFNVLFYIFRFKQIVFIRETIKPDWIRKFAFSIINFVSQTVITVSYRNSDDFMKATKSKKRVETIFSAVEKIDQKVSLDIGMMQKEFGGDNFGRIVDNSRFKFICVGNISPLKNQLLIVEAFREIKQNAPDLNPICIFVGDNTEKKSYVAKVEAAINEYGMEDDFIFLGRQLRQVTYGVMSLSNALIIASENEGMPLLLSEALQFGLPVISTKVGGVEDVIIDGTNGLITENDPLMLADKIVSIMNKEIIHRIKSNLAETYVRYFDLDKNMLEVDHIVRSLLN